MAHLPILPILIPLLTALLLLLPPLTTSLLRQRLASCIGMGITLLVSILLLQTSLDGTQIYALGDWQPPFGIVLWADPMATLLVTLCTILAFATLLSSVGGHDKGGMFFHPLFQFQIVGINGAFLTGDLFNLFVFFEILLIASYALLIHGGGKEKTQAGFHYVTLNLLGSAFFLFALGIIYGTLGTLNMADLAYKASQIHADDQQLARTGVFLLLVVFGLKAAILPLHFWLSRTYGAAVAPIAALFAIMTKVGIYSLYRVHIMIFGDHAGDLANLVIPWLWPLALLTLAFGAIGALAARRLRDLTSWLVVVSVGTLLFSIAMNRVDATATGLYYLIHSTLISGALYLLSDLIATQRGQAADRFVSARPLGQNALLGALFVICALTVVGMPPLSGFVGKLGLMQVADGLERLWFWPVLLIGGLLSIIALSRAGTTIFWRVRGNKPGNEPVCRWQLSGVIILIVLSPLMVIFGESILQLSYQAASALHAPPAPLTEMLSPATGGQN